MTVFGPEFSMGTLPGLYMLNTDVLELCLPRMVTEVHLPSPCGSSPFEIIAEDIFPNAMMAVPPGL